MSRLEIRGSPDPGRWWEVARSCPWATFFHTPLWHGLASRAFDAVEDASLEAETPGGTRLILPVARDGRDSPPAFATLRSTFAGCYGGVIADGPVEEEEERALHRSLPGWRTDRVALTGNPLRREGAPEPGDPFEGREDFTQILELEGRDFDDVVSGFSKGHASSMSRAEREGVTVREAESLEDYRAYFGAYEDSLRRWGEDATTRYPWRLFRRGFELSRKHPELIRLWLAEVEGSVAAGAWVFYWNGHADYWHGAAYEEYFDHHPNQLLQAEILRDALARGIRYYDFNPSGGHEGVAAFKKHFGAGRWPLRRWEHRGALPGLVRRICALPGALWPGGDEG